MRLYTIRLLTVSVLVTMAVSRVDATVMLAPPLPQLEHEVGVATEVKHIIAYEFDGEESQVERTTASAFYGYKWFFVGAMAVTDSDIIRDDSISGDGFMVGLGSRWTVWELNEKELTVYSQLSYLSEDYDRGGVTAELESVDLLAGIISSYYYEDYTLYGGVELSPFTDAELGGSVEVERVDIFSLKAGGTAEFESFLLNVDVLLFGSQTIRIGISRAF